MDASQLLGNFLDGLSFNQSSNAGQVSRAAADGFEFFDDAIFVRNDKRTRASAGWLEYENLFHNIHRFLR